MQNINNMVLAAALFVAVAHLAGQQKPESD